MEPPGAMTAEEEYNCFFNSVSSLLLKYWCFCPNTWEGQSLSVSVLLASATRCFWLLPQIQILWRFGP